MFLFRLHYIQGLLIGFACLFIDTIYKSDYNHLHVYVALPLFPLVVLYARYEGQPLILPFVIIAYNYKNFVIYQTHNSIRTLMMTSLIIGVNIRIRIPSISKKINQYNAA
jgi:hypothetical protein